MEIDVYWERGGDPLLLVKAGSPPTLIDYDAQYGLMRLGFNSVYMPKLVANQMYYFAVFNRKFDADSDCVFRISLTSASWNRTMTSPNMVSMALVLFVSMSFCFVVSLIKRYFQRRYLTQFREQRVQQLSMEELQRRRVNARHPGTPEEIISRIDLVEYHSTLKEAMLAEGQEPTCTICLDDYAEGDKLRRFPQCKHMFHQECADLWLHTSHTCPNCRASLLPGDEETAAPAESAQAASNASMPSGVPGGAYELTPLPYAPNEQVEPVHMPQQTTSTHGLGGATRANARPFDSA
jgi:hypothetical protein